MKEELVNHPDVALNNSINIQGITIPPVPSTGSTSTQAINKATE